MKSLKKRISWKMRFLAWLLVVAMVSGNLSQVGYAAQSQPRETADQRVIKITEKDIERILDRDPERRPELELKDIPFKGDLKKQNVLDEILSLTEGKVLIKKQRNGTSLCLIYAEKDGLDIDFYYEDAEENEDECLVDYLEIYTINAGDKPVEYKVVLDSDTMVIEEATSSEFKVVGDNEDFVIATDSNAVKATDSNASKDEGETEAPVNPSETDQAGDTTQDSAQEETESQPSGEETSENPTAGEGQQDTVDNSGQTLPSGEAEEQKPQEETEQETSEAAPTEKETEKETEEETRTEKETEEKAQKEEAEEPQELSISVHQKYLVTSSDDDDEEEGAGLVSLSFDEDTTQEVMESLQEEGGVVSRVGAGMIKSTRLMLVPSTPFFEAVSEALGDPDDAEDNQVVVGSIAVSPDKVGEIMAGEEFHLTVNYAMNAVPPYSYNGGTVSLYTPNEVKQGKIILTVPADLILPQQSAYREKDITGDTAVYNIPISDESASGKMVLNAYFAGNGSTAIGTVYEMSDTWAAAYSGYVTAVDPMDSSSAMEYKFCDYGQRESLDEELNEDMYQWELVSPDVWAVNKEITNVNGVGEPVTLDGQDAVKFDFEITVGLNQADGPAVGDANYFRPGRVPFESYLLTDTLTLHDKEGKPTDIAPLRVELVPEGKNKGESLTPEEPVKNSSTITTRQYATAGHPGEDTGLYKTDDGAPALTSYRVTAYYAREDFKLDFWDTQVQDGATYKVRNDVVIDYELLSVNDKGKRASINDDAEGYYQFVEGSSTIQLEKKLLIPALESGKLTTEKVPFDEKYGGFYEGYAGFTVEKMGEDGSYHTYKPKVLENGAYENLEHIAINPVADSRDGDIPEQGTDGTLVFYVEPGTYRITETELPDKTEPGPGMKVNIQGQAYFEITVKLNDKETVIFENEVKSGGLQFSKMGYEYKNHGLSGVSSALQGVTFELFDEQGTSVGTAVSDKNGTVSFFPLDAGNYTLKEVSTPEGYILDLTEYTVEVAPGKIARPGKGGEKLETIFNYPNKSAVKVVKWIATPGQERDEREPVSSQQAKDYAKLFRVEYKQGNDNWTVYQENLSLDEKGEIYLDLPVYMNGKTEDAEATVYRVVEAVPNAYTSKTYQDGEAAYYQTYSQEDRLVTSREFTLKEPGELISMETVNITNILRSGIALAKYNAGYAAVSGDNDKAQITSKPAGQGEATFQLLQKTGENAYRSVGSGKTNAQGEIAFSNLDIWDGDGEKIEYYWYEAPKSGNKLEVFDGEYASDAAGKTLTVSNVQIDSQSYDTAVLAGPFELTAGSTVRAYAYNVAQKLPVWIYKQDKGTGETVFWVDNNEDTQFEFTIYKLNSDGNEAAETSVVVKNDGKPVYLDAGYKYKVYETTHPKSYKEFNDPKAPSDTRGVYQIIDLTKRAEVSMDSSLQEAKGGNLTTFVNQRLSRLQVVKQSRTIGDDLLTADSPRKDIEFEVYTRDGNKFISTGRTIKSDDSAYWFEAGTYYVREKAVPKDHIDPATYLAVGDYTTDSDLRYYRDGKNIYYGPIEVKESKKEVAVGSIEVINYLNVGTVQAIKKSGNTGEYLGGAVIVLEKQEGVAYKQVDKQTSDAKTGLVTFNNVPIYDDNGNKITYRLREITAPDGYTLNDDTKYDVVLDQKDLLTTADVNQKPLEFTNNRAINLTVRKFWTDKWESQFDHRDIKNELPGVDLVLYKWNQSGDAELVTVSKSDQDAAAAAFRGLDSKLAYFVVEGQGADGYEPQDGRQILTKENDAYPNKLSVSGDGVLQGAPDGGTYNYVYFPVQEGAAVEVDRSGEILNERPWVQFNLHKYADQILYEENGENRTPVRFEYNGIGQEFYAEDLEPNQDVNGARFEFHETKLADGLEANLSGSTLIDVYETGTKLQGLTGEQVVGEFDTTIMRPGNIFWLKEVEAGPGYSWGDRPQIIAFVPADQMSQYELEVMDGQSYYTQQDGTRVKVVSYDKNTTVSADAYNYDMTDIGEGRIETAYVKLNKWLETELDGKKQYTPLGGVTFALRVDGITITTLETGLDNKWDGSDKTGQAMSEMLYFDKIVETLKAHGRTDEEIAKWVDSEARTVTFELVEISAPDRVEMMTGTKTLTVSFASGSPIDTTYFWAENDPEEKRLINTQLDGYRVELKVWGYNPTEELFQATDGAITDAKLEQIDWLKTEALDQVELQLYKYNYAAGKYERFMADTTIRTNDGTYVFADGLPRGKYYLVETGLGDENKDRYFNMYNNTNWYREFTVNASEQNVVNVYNPEKPNLEIRKHVLSGQKVDLEGLTLLLENKTDKYTRTYNKDVVKDSIDQNTVQIDHINPGEYTLTENGKPQNTSIQYFNVHNSTELSIGFKREKANSTPQIQKRDAIKNYEYVSKVELDLYNPQKGSLKLIKTDAENPELKLEDAKFQYSYLPFAVEKGDFSSDKSYVVRSAGLVEDETLLQDLASREWGKAIDTEATGKNGELLLDHLDPGWYRITETKAPEGYTANREPIYMAVVADMGEGHTMPGADELPTATVENRHDVTLTVTKNLDYGQLTDHKDALPDTVTFRLYKGIEGGVIADTGKSVEVMSKDGRTAPIEGIPQLTAKEIAENYHYYLAETVVKSDEWTFTGAVDNQDEEKIPLKTVVKDNVTYIELPGFTTKADVKITVTNRLAKADITLMKVDQDSKAALAGAVFGLYTTNQTASGTGLPADTAKIGNFTDKGGGIYEITNVPAAGVGTKYYIFEITAPEHYVRKIEPVEVTVTSGQHLTYETPENAGQMTIANESGVDISLVKHPDVYQGPESGTIQKTGVKFDLYVRDTTQDGSGWTKVGDTREPDADGTIKWAGLKLADREYALYEHDITGGTYENYTLDGIYLSGVKMEQTTELNGRTLHILTGMSAGRTFGFEAYNRPAELVNIRKVDANGNQAPEAVFRILDENGQLVQIHGLDTVQTAQVSGKDYTEAKVPLKAGSYTLEEIQTAAGYNLIPDDNRVITSRKIQVPDAENQNTFVFSNLRIDPTVDLSKQVAAVNETDVSAGQTGVLENLWWNDSQTVRYELTPALGDRITGEGNNGTIEYFALTDSGLTMQGPDGNDLPYDVYTKNNYTFTELVIPRPAHESFIIRDGEAVEAGAVTVTVTAEYFDGSQNTYQYTFDQSAQDSWTLDLGADSGVKGFTITYEDA